MNKRILKLFNEAGFHQPEMERLGIEDKFEKFAELIVNECADMVAGSSLPDAYSEPVLEEIADEMREHFGVEK